MASCLVVILAEAGCDGVFRLTPVDPPPDSPPDVPSDVAIDAATMLECVVSPIIARPNGDSMATWRDQVPMSGTHVDQIDDEVADEDLSYIATPFDGQIDLFTHVPLAATVKIDSVRFYVRARIEVANGTHSLGPAFQEGASFQWDDRILSTSWTDVSSDLYVNDPATGLPWTFDGFNATTMGIRKAYTTDPVRVTQIWASVACHRVIESSSHRVIEAQRA